MALMAMYQYSKAGLIRADFVENGEAAWNRAFTDLENGAAFPIGILDEHGNFYDRLHILQVYTDSNTESKRQEVKNSKRESENGEPKAGNEEQSQEYRSEYDRMFEEMNEKEREWLIKEAVKHIPLFFREYYTREIRKGKTLNDMPTVKALVMEHRDKILDHIKKRCEEVGIKMK